jgi:hypothetical protein
MGAAADRAGAEKASSHGATGLPALRAEGASFPAGQVPTWKTVLQAIARRAPEAERMIAPGIL